ncbi:MAG: methyltransferase domain-containing protein [Micromonosporaceae bacterium]|jgi:SAM-dependent methyltransferase|nr:methyltransferase domain-containing protein [Micromonosporaceae bacterium]
MTVTGSTTQDTYAFSNADPEAQDRHAQLSAMLDPFTFARLSTVGDLTGRRCLEVGAGGGSVARWLAEQVGSGGRVLATDIDTSRLPPDPPYEVLRHDITREPVPPGPWDLIHARLVLIHLPQRRQILRNLAAALAPGGALVLEDWDATIGNFVLAAPDEDAVELFNDYQAGLMKIMASGGNDSAWGRRAHAAMIEAGLVDVDTEIHARSWPGGTPGALIITVNIAQLREQFRAAGFTDERLDALIRLAHDPRMVWRGHVLFSTIGRRPAESGSVSVSPAG